MYLSIPNFLRLAFQPIYDLKSPFRNRDAIENINYVQNILASVKTASLIDQITGQDYQEMTRKCILNRSIDLYTDAWSKCSKAREVPSEKKDDTSVGAALKKLSLSVTSLKKAALTVNQVHFFIAYLVEEIKQLNFLESRGNTDNRQATTRGRYQNNQRDKQFRPRCQAFNLIEQRNINPQQQNMGYNQQQQSNQNPPQNMGYPQQQQINQSLQQRNSIFQQGNQQNQQQGLQRKVPVSFFPCPLGCGHVVPWGSLAGCDNFVI